MVKGFSIIFGILFLLQTFLLYNWILQKKFNFFLQILKVEHKNFPTMYLLSYLDIKHWILRGGDPGFQAGIGLSVLFFPFFG